MKTPMHHSHSAASAGFTLLELLIVVGIVLILAGMLMPILTLAQRESKRWGTRTTMIKTDIALRLFRNEFGSFPYQKSYADLAAGEAWTNRLYYHLGTDIAADDLAKVIAEADAASDRYRAGVGDLRFTAGDTPPNVSPLQIVSNRMARERVRLAIFAGNTGIAHVAPLPSGAPTPVLGAAGPVLSNPTSTGMAKDYLYGELPASLIAGETILDAWHHPIIYVCQVVEGMHSTPWADTILTNLDARSLNLHSLGRRSLAQRDRITRTALVVHPTQLPDTANLRHSDRRSHAAWMFELEPELWSAGSDGLADWIRDAAVNHDNVSLLPYDKDIP